MNDKAIYYNEHGQECSPEEASHMCVYIYDDAGNFIQRITSACKNDKMKE